MITRFCLAVFDAFDLIIAKILFILPDILFTFLKLFEQLKCSIYMYSILGEISCRGDLKSINKSSLNFTYKSFNKPNYATTF